MLVVGGCGMDLYDNHVKPLCTSLLPLSSYVSEDWKAWNRLKYILTKENWFILMWNVFIWKKLTWCCYCGWPEVAFVYLWTSFRRFFIIAFVFIRFKENHGLWCFSWRAWGVLQKRCCIQNKYFKIMNQSLII